MTEVQRLAKIMVLKDMRKEYELRAKYNGGVDYDCYRALDMAIEELAQEPCKDAISRQAALSHKVYTETEEGWSGYTVDADIIENLPSVNPAEKEGRCIDAEILDKIRAEIIKYEGDCRLSVDEYPSCKQCTDNTFETIYAILDKYKASPTGEESEGGTQHDN